jgi:IMP dehydrogenase/GMP reductase
MVSQLRAEKVLVVADEVLTGGRMSRLIASLDAQRVQFGTHVVALADFGSPTLRLGRPVVSVVTEKIPLWTPSDCPMCAAGSCGKRRIEL